MERVAYSLVGILGLALVATILTESTMAFGRSHLADDRLARPVATVTPAPATSSTPSPTPTPASTPSPTPTLTPTPAAAPTATTISYVRLRAGASIATAVVAEFRGGEVVTLGAYSDSQWQEVTYNGLHGYVFKAYLRYN